MQVVNDPQNSHFDHFPSQIPYKKPGNHSKDANPVFVKNEARFFGVTPTITQQEAGFERNWRAFYGVEEEKEDRGRQWERNVKMFFGVEEGEKEGNSGKMHFDPRLRHSADTRSLSLPAGKRIPRDSAWRPSDSHDSQVMFPAVNLPSTSIVSSLPAGKKVIRDVPWKPEDDYRFEDMFIRRKETFQRKKRESGPAGKIVEKDQPWSLAAGYSEKSSFESYRKNTKFVAVGPNLRGQLSGGSRPAGKEIPRDPVFTLALGAEVTDMRFQLRAQNKSALAKYGAESMDRGASIRASLDSHPYGLHANKPMAGFEAPGRDYRSLTPELYPAGVPSQRDSLHRSGHNPILNPIGAQLPGPLYRRPGRR